MEEQQSQALAVRDDARMAFNYTKVATQLVTEALEAGALVGKVTNSDEQVAAVEAQGKISEILKAIEKARVQAKEPVLTFGRRIDETAKTFARELKEEEVRIAGLIGDFQAIELAKVRAAQQAEQARLTALERERAKALAASNTIEEMDKVQEQFNTRAAQEAPPVVAPTRVAGQVVREDWDVTVTNPFLLANGHPGCVTITPRLTEIKALLNAGVKVAGVIAVKVCRASVRTKPQQKAIEA